MSLSGPSTLRRSDLLFAGGLFLLSAFGLSLLTLWLDDTTYGTGNGLWKAVWIRQFIAEGVDWDNIQELSFYSNLLYFPTYAFLSQLLPESWSMVMRMAVINSWFGALAASGVFLLGKQLFRDWKWALLAFFLQIAMGNFLSVSTDSEDIIPSYALFVWALVAFVHYLRTDRKTWLILTVVLYTLSWFFHWTMAVAPAPAFALVLFLHHRDLRKTGIDLGVFLGGTFVLLMLVFMIYGAQPDRILFPAKGEGGAWLGFAGEKFILLFSGMSCYVMGGFQFNGLEIFYETISDSWYLPEFLFATLLILLAVRSWIFYYRKTNSVADKSLVIFLLVLFLVGQLMNVYEFGTDLQFHIQPMIFLPLGLVAGLSLLAQRMNRSGWIALFGFALAFGIGGRNLLKFRLPHQGTDSRQLEQIKLLSEKVPDPASVLWLTRGWDDFRNWAYMSWGDDFRENTHVIVDYLADHPEESTEAAAERLRNYLKGELERGKTIIAGPEVIDREAYEIVDTFSGFGQNEKAEELIRLVREDFVREPFVPVGDRTFYRLTAPVPPGD